MVTYVDTGNNIRVSYLDSEGQWKDGDFPDLSASDGVSAAVDPASQLRLVAVRAGNDIEVVWGLGPTVWDNEWAGPTPGQTPTSAPSVSYSGEREWLIAFNAGGTVSLRIYDAAAQSFSTVSLAPTTDAANDSVTGVPSVAYGKGTILLAWSRSTEIRIASSPYAKGQIPAWNHVASFSLPSQTNNDCYGGASSDPVVAYDGDEFFIAFTRSTKRCPDYEGEQLNSTDLFIYRSSDTQSWTQAKVIKQIPNPVKGLALAAWANEILVGATASSRSSLWLVSPGGATTEVSAGLVFKHPEKKVVFSIAAPRAKK